MKKWIAIMLACALCLTGCVRNLDNIPSRELVLQQGEEWSREKLAGYTPEQLREVWGEPDGTLSGMWGEMWYVDGTDSGRVSICYDANGKAETVRIETASIPEQEKEVPSGVAPPDPTDAALLSHPPQLRVVCGGEEVRTLNGGFSWVTEDGILCADALHPLQLREYVTDYVCAQTVQDWAALQFTDVEGGFLVYPEQVTARAWEEDCTPTCDCLSTDVSVENLSMQLLPGGYVYEVIARWGDGETGGGVTTHMFWVNKLYPGNE